MPPLTQGIDHTAATGRVIDPPTFPTEAPFTCEYCRHEAADCLLVFELSGGTSDRRIKSLTCTPCGRRGIKDAEFGDFAKAIYLYRLTPDAEVSS